jgi:hypothetical protein
MVRVQPKGIKALAFRCFCSFVPLFSLPRHHLVSFFKLSYFYLLTNKHITTGLRLNNVGYNEMTITAGGGNEQRDGGHTVGGGNHTGTNDVRRQCNKGEANDR